MRRSAVEGDWVMRVSSGSRRDTAGVKKRVNPHAFRHSRATFLANNLTEAQMKEYFGWVQSSGMAAVYVHLSGRDVDNAILKLHGLAETHDNEDVPKVKNCARCRERNSPVSKFCCGCGSPLDIQTTIELDEKRKTSDEVISLLVKDPQVQHMIVEKIFSDTQFSSVPAIEHGLVISRDLVGEHDAYAEESYSSVI